MPTRRLDTETLNAEGLLDREWIVTNGLGGYSSGTVIGSPSRRYHGLLVAALPSPHGRVVVVDGVSESLVLDDGRVVDLSGLDRLESLTPPGAFVGFAMEMGLPVWTFRAGPIVIEKRVVMSHLQNSTHVNYRLIEGEGRLRIRVRPWIAFRPHEHAVAEEPTKSLSIEQHGDRYEVTGPESMPSVSVCWRGRGKSGRMEPFVQDMLRYRLEEERGGPHLGTRQSPLELEAEIGVDSPVSMTVSVEPGEAVCGLSPDQALRAELHRRERLLQNAHVSADEGATAELVLAADQFIVVPAGRVREATLAHAEGDEVRSVIAGYHWFTDWGRDTMISLEGLALVTGRHREAADILVTFAHHVRDGLIPNLFPEGKEQGLYHTADASLWFFHAVDRYLAVTEDMVTFEELYPKLVDIVEHHCKGTRFGIGVDPSDGLLRQGAEGYQLTWMDAKVDGWVVTPRRGKAVELNALWYNALRLLEGWHRRKHLTEEAERIGRLAAQTYRSFNERFWNPAERCLFDIVDAEAGGDDPACRPNQVFALSLAHPVLDPAHWREVLEAVRSRLLTPMGLRSLAPGHPDYKPRYFGDLRSRDAAYHQGTVWAWLIGPYIDAWLRCYPDDLATVTTLLADFDPELSLAGVGTISEIFDAEAPYTPRGCIAQAWSVAETLRCLMMIRNRKR